jgi:ubiquinone/menaquinone biosynthesis C-methylase UbiE
MHPSAMRWVGGEVAHHGLDGKTLEVGALDVNGSVRQLFTGPYVGVDFRSGKGVDRVMDAHALDFPDASFDIVVSTEMLEHDSAFWLSLAEMARVLRPGGDLILTARGNGFPEHAHPFDYWRFMDNACPLLLDLASCDAVCVQADPRRPGVFIHGRRCATTS